MLETAAHAREETWQRKSSGFVKLQIPAGKANPAPPVGTALGPQGINIMAFCKEFNARTQGQDTILPVEITIYGDKSFTFILKTPPAAVLLKKEAGIEKGSGQPNRNKVGKVTKAQVRKIAEIKMPDLNCDIDRVGHGDGRRRGALDGRGGRRLMRDPRQEVPQGRREAPRDRVDVPAASRRSRSSRPTAFAKFDETVDVAVRLGVDPRHADQIVRGTVVLPAGTGKTVRVLVIAVGDKAKEAEAAGADFVGTEYVAKIKDGWLDFDVHRSPRRTRWASSAPLGRVLGPRGLMPNPKAGTVTFDVARAVKEIKAGKIEFRVDKARQRPRRRSARCRSRSKRSKRTSRPSWTPSSARSRARRRACTCKTVAVSSTMGPGVRGRHHTLPVTSDEANRQGRARQRARRRRWRAPTRSTTPTSPGST